jgi:hypothetical protein
MLKLWFPSRDLPNLAIHSRTISSHSLHIRHNNHIFASYLHLLKWQWGMNHSLPTCKWSLHIFHLSIPECRMKNLLWILYIHRYLKHWHYFTICSDSHCFHRICSAWEQIPFSGATVTTNLLSVISYIGSNLVEWIWGRFFSW